LGVQGGAGGIKSVFLWGLGFPVLSRKIARKLPNLVKGMREGGNWKNIVEFDHVPRRSRKLRMKESKKGQA